MTSEVSSGLEPESGRDRLLRKVLDYFSENGIGDASLRQIAAGIGSSHRMLIYHFGTREGLLTAAMDAIEAREKAVLSEMMAGAAPGVDARIMMWRFWTHIADVGAVYGPLFFEMTSVAMRGDDVNAALRAPNIDMWVTALAALYAREFGLGKAEARAQARLILAATRGLLLDLLLTGDRRAADVAMARLDFLLTGTPHPLAAVRRLTRNWVYPAT